jgi:hypothetical protein
MQGYKGWRNFREVIMALQGHLEAMKMEEVVAWLTSWLRTGAAKEPVEKCGVGAPRAPQTVALEHEHQTLCIRGLL